MKVDEEGRLDGDIWRALPRDSSHARVAAVIAPPFRVLCSVGGSGAMAWKSQILLSQPHATPPRRSSLLSLAASQDKGERAAAAKGQHEELCVARSRNGARH